MEALERVLVGSAPLDLLEAEHRLRAAQLNADVAALEDLIADDLLFIGPDGNSATKAQDVEAHKSGLVRFLDHKPLRLEVRLFDGNVAFVLLRAQLRVAIAGDIHEGTYQYARVWHRSAVGGPWRVAGGAVFGLPTAA